MVADYVVLIHVFIDLYQKMRKWPGMSTLGVGGQLSPLPSSTGGMGKEVPLISSSFLKSMSIFEGTFSEVIDIGSGSSFLVSF